eukprot:Phypoly_transcript_04535.p1 GENE.Phypoly_transcript_04535~~Phypoly_transcript_04535.p1  ORF type:complete len:546 (+),score=114.95 Phypoly_transcript_04535:83-1720(+)
MREVITLQVGHYGNKVGRLFWEQLFAEHGLDPTGSYEGTSPDSQLVCIDSYFSESDCKSGLSYTPHALCVDLDPRTPYWLKETEIGRCYRSNNFIFGEYGAGDCWAKGFYDQGMRVIGEVMASLRKEIERCDSLQGFQILHALGGGTGSGFGAKILSEIMETYYSKICIPFSLYPTPALGYKSVVEPYNTVLALHYLIENSTSSVCVDSVLQHRAHGDFPQETLYRTVAMMMSDVTACNRFPSTISGDLKKMETNLLIYPRLKFFLPSVSLPSHSLFLPSHSLSLPTRSSLFPSLSPSLSPYTNHALPFLLHQLFNPQNIMASCNPHNIFLFNTFSTHTMAIAHVSGRTFMANLKDNTSSCFAEWLPNHIKCFVTKPPIPSSLPSPTSLSYLFASPASPLQISSSSSPTTTSSTSPLALSHPTASHRPPSTSSSSPTSSSSASPPFTPHPTPSYHPPSTSPSSSLPSSSPFLPPVSATCLSNTSAITDLFCPILDDFNATFSRRAFLRPYIDHMDEMEFMEAESNLQDLIDEYKFYENNITYDDE